MEQKAQQPIPNSMAEALEKASQQDEPTHKKKNISSGEDAFMDDEYEFCY